jgi:hypothetical protein
MPSSKLRKLEVTANEAFDTYRELYYEGGLSSVYLWDLDDGGFAGVVLLKKGACTTSLSCDHQHLSSQLAPFFPAHPRLSTPAM